MINNNFVIYHRVSSTGELKLADFGLAKTYDFEMKLTSVVRILRRRTNEDHGEIIKLKF